MGEGSGPHPRVAEPSSMAALLTRTSKELLGERPLPTVLRARPVVYVLGAPGCGKSTVAQRLAPAGSPAYDAESLRKALNLAARQRKWAEVLTESPGIIFDGVDCLHRRYGVIRLLGELLRMRADAGRRTVLVAGDTDTSVALLYPELPCEQRATVLLRFPVGGGRRRFVNERCAARGIDPARGAGAFALEPWSYAGVERYLDELS